MAPKAKQVSGSSLRTGTKVWIAGQADSDEVWRPAEVKEDLKPGAEVVKVMVSTTHEELSLSIKDPILLANDAVESKSGSLTGVEDLATLMHLHEPEVLQHLQLRFDMDDIYTFCGEILIAVNPFKGIHGLYERSTLDKVVREEECGTSIPHIFTIASRTLNHLQSHSESQVCLISGESGAGKTETTKHVLKFLSETMGGGGDKPGRKSTVDRSKDGDISTEEKIMNSNPLLEAFGNACTVRNNNSSRFGKFIEMRFKAAYALDRPDFVGAYIETYLLEKVRVTEVTKNEAKPPAKGQQPKEPKQERSYHIFYQVCAACKKLGGDAFGLPLHVFDDAGKYNYLNKSPKLSLPGLDDADAFAETVQSMQDLGMPLEAQANIVKIVGAVLNLGNVVIEEEGGEGSKVQQGNKYFEIVAQMLKIDRMVLQRALTFRFIQVSKTESYDRPLRPKEAEDAREALARALYGALFLYIVSQVNISLAGPGMEGSRQYIGVLDIFGFESFETNSFEQLCINFANERLQKLFNDFVFMQEMKLYEAEGVACDRTDFPDNSDIIQLVQGKAPVTSIFTSLDEACRVPGGSDQGFCDKVRKEFGTKGKEHPRFAANPRYQSTFTINHFAGPVTYETARFLDKNNDEIGDLLKQALAKSEEKFITTIILEHMGGAEGGSGKMKKMTVSSLFKGQLESLMSKLSKAQPHFVRCVKPNPENLAGRFNRKTVVEQLRSGGVIEALRVQRAGFPCRVLVQAEGKTQTAWKDFLRLLVTSEEHSALEKISDMKARCEKALEKVAPRIPLKADDNGITYVVGKTRVFFKQAAFESLEGAVKAKRHQATLLIQKRFKREMVYRIYQIMRRGIISIQATYRGHALRKEMWEAATQQQRATSLIFKRYRSEEDEIAAQEQLEQEKEAERQKQLEEEAELKRLQAEAAARLKAEQDKKKAEEEARKKAEEDRRKAEEEKRAAEEKRRKEEEEKRMAEFKRKADEERKKAEETKGMYMKEIQLMQDRFAEREKALLEEVNIIKKERDDQLATFSGQLDIQKEALLSSCRQEVDFVKQQGEQRETSLMQMIERSRHGESEKLKSFEVQLTLKDKQAAEIKRCLEAKVQHLEEANARAQELYNQHVEQLMKQLVEKDANFERQMNMAEDSSTKQLEEMNREMRALEQRVQKEREQQRVAMQAIEGAAPENEKLQSQLNDAYQEISDLKSLLSSAMSRLKAQSEAKKEEPAPPKPKGVDRRASLMRMTRVTSSTQKAKWGPAEGAQRAQLNRRRTIVGFGGDAMGSTTSMKPLKSIAPAAMGGRMFQGVARDVSMELLRPSLNRDEEECEGKVALWKSLKVKSSVTNVCIGSLPLSSTHVCMVVATRMGLVHVFHVLASYTGPDEGDAEAVVEKLKFQAHDSAVTYICFGQRQDELITSSSDCHVRVWSTKDGNMLQDIVEASSVTCALPLRRPGGSLVIATGGDRDVAPLLRLCDGEEQLQKVRMEHAALALCADAKSTRLMAGTNKGAVMIYNVEGDKTFEFCNKLQATKKGITCLTIGEQGLGMKPLVVCNTVDKALCVLEANLQMTNLTVLHRFAYQHIVLPIRNCYVPTDDGTSGFIVTGDEDGKLNIYDMGSFDHDVLPGNKAVVVDVACSDDATLLATGDVSGNIQLWRRGP
mmetsp:Transcript_1682/g.4333  ORF Transcript_1682/g.4333 Transcript_1682/m.4333 type:complete len:1653 (-) Transcript_1682:108-5066(-)